MLALESASSGHCACVLKKLRRHIMPRHFQSPPQHLTLPAHTQKASTPRPTPACPRRSRTRASSPALCCSPFDPPAPPTSPTEPTALSPETSSLRFDLFSDTSPTPNALPTPDPLPSTVPSRNQLPFPPPPPPPDHWHYPHLPALLSKDQLLRPLHPVVGREGPEQFARPFRARVEAPSGTRIPQSLRGRRAERPHGQGPKSDGRLRAISVSLVA